MNNLDEDESCLSSSSSLVENEVIVLNGKIKPTPSSSSSSSTTLSDHCIRVKLEDSTGPLNQHSLINQIGLISSNNQQSFRRNSHLNLASDFCTDNNNNSTITSTNNSIGTISHTINNTNSNNNINNCNNNHHNNSLINQANGKLSVQYINVSYNTTGLSNCSTITSSPPVSTLVSSSLSSSSILSLSSNFKNDSNPILHPSAIKLEPLEMGGGDKRGFNSLTTTTVTTSSSSSTSLGSTLKLESMSSVTNKGLTSSHLTDCFISCPVDDLDSVKSNLSLTHHSLHSHLHGNHSPSVTSNHHTHHSQHHTNHHHHHSHHHSHHQRVLISPTDFLSLTEESTSAVSAVKKDVNLSTSRLEIIKKSNDTHGLTVSLDRYCESPFLIDSHREIHLISDDDASNNGRASRLSETHEELPTEDLFAATLADDQHNAIREVVITPIEPDNNSCSTPITLTLTVTDIKNSSTSPLPSPVNCSSPSLSSSALSSPSIVSSSSSSITCSTSLLTSVSEVLTTKTTVSSTPMVNGFDLALVKEEKFDEDESVEQMIVEEAAVDNDPSLVNGMVDDDVDDDVDLLNSESRSASTSTVTTFSVLNTLHNNSSIRLTPEESSSSLELRPNPLTEQINTIPLQSSSLSSSSSSSSLTSSSLTSSSLSSSSPPTLMAQIPSFSHFGKQSTSSLSSNGSGSLVQITFPPTPSSSSLATTPPTPNSTLSTGAPLTPILSTSAIGPSPASPPSSLSLSSQPSTSSTGLIAVTSSSSTLSSSSSTNNCVISNSGSTIIGHNSVISAASLSSLTSSNSSSPPSSTPTSTNAPSANVTLPLTPLDIKILPGGLLQFAANVAAVFPSSTILQKQLALQLLREDGTSIILPLTTRSSDSTSATIASGFSANNSTNTGPGGLGLATTTTNHTIHANANNKVATTVSVLGNSGSLIGSVAGRAGGLVVTGGLGLGAGLTGGASANLTETIIPTLSTSQLSLSNERFEQPQSQQSQLIQQQQQQIVGTARDPINSTKLLNTTENPGQNTEIDRPFKCELCNSTFTRLGNYTRHKKIHSLPSKEDQRFRCDICGKSFIQRCDLARHLHIHRGTEPHRCSQCGKGYIRHSDLVTHQRFHNKEKPFACPHCSKGFCQRGDLNRHLRSIHLQLKPILCSHCHKKFAKEETLLRHINSNHRDTVVT